MPGSRTKNKKPRKEKKIKHKLDDQYAENSHRNSLSGYLAQFLELSQLAELRIHDWREMPVSSRKALLSPWQMQCSSPLAFPILGSHMAIDSGKGTLGRRSHPTFIWTQCVTDIMSRNLKHHHGPAVMNGMHEMQGIEHITVLIPAYRGITVSEDPHRGYFTFCGFEPVMEKSLWLGTG